MKSGNSRKSTYSMPICRACARSATGKPGRSSRAESTRRRCASRASRPRASSPSGRLRGCEACLASSRHRIWKARLLGFNPDFGHDAPKDLSLFLDEGSELLGRRPARLERELLERFAHVRPLEHHDELAPNPPDDLLWHVRRTEHPAPWRDRQWTQARLRQRRRLRQERTAARQQRGQHLELALPHLRRGGPGGRDGELHPTAEKVDRQRPVSLVWNVHHVELLLLHELRR